jgi:hypothetical protein
LFKNEIDVVVTQNTSYKNELDEIKEIHKEELRIYKDKVIKLK